MIFLTACQRQHYLRHCDPTVTEDQKVRLQSSPPFAESLFDPSTLKSVVEEYDGASATAHNRSVAKALTGGSSFFFGKRKRDFGQGQSSSAGSVASTSTSDQPGVGSPLFDAPSRGGGYWPRGNKGKGRGNQRGKGGSRSLKSSRGFQK